MRDSKLIEKLAHLILETPRYDVEHFPDEQAKPIMYRQLLADDFPQAVKDIEEEMRHGHELTPAERKVFHILKASHAILGALEALEKNGDTKVKAGLLQDAYRLAAYDEQFYRDMQRDEKRAAQGTTLYAAEMLADQYEGNFREISRLGRMVSLEKMDAAKEVKGLLEDLMGELKVPLPGHIRTQ